MSVLVYQILLEHAQAMLQVAEAGDWDTLSLLGESRAALLQRVKQADISDTSVRTLAEQILACDRALDALVTARCTELTQLLGVVGNERKLAFSYGASQF